MRTLLFFKENVLDANLCDEIISKFYAEETNKYDGVTSAGTNKDIKDTMDLSITQLKYSEDNETNRATIIYWDGIIELIKGKLLENIVGYFDQIKGQYDIFNFTIFKGRLFFDTILFQRYKQNKGLFRYHEDSLVDLKGNKTRILTFLIYLNDVDEGGETEFFGNFRIKPQKGKLLLFPANWCFPHSGLMPISGNKYILTGWIYANIL